MAKANIVSFDQAMRLRGSDAPRIVTDDELRRRQATVRLDNCHVAVDRLTYQIKSKARRFCVFHDLSVTFPKGRRIVVLGHSGAGKTTLFELMLQERPPTRGRIVINSRLSWPVHSSAFLDPRLSVRQNTVFISHILGVDGRKMLDTVQRFLELPAKRLHEPVKALSPKLRRRFGVVAVMAADFECLLIDMPMKGALFGLDGRRAEALEATILDHDYIMATNAVRHVPANCDLVYILYEGRFYLFEDPDEAKRVFNGLPIPPNPGGRREQPAEDEEDEDEYREEAF